MKLHEITDSRPLIWRIAAQQLEKGKKILFHATMPHTSGYVVGPGRVIGSSRALIDGMIPFRKEIIIAFSADDDKFLTMRPSNDTSVADYTIVDIV